jgi:hypothetical protein
MVPQSWPGCVWRRENLLPPGFEPWTVEPLVQSIHRTGTGGFTFRHHLVCTYRHTHRQRELHGYAIALTERVRVKIQSARNTPVTHTLATSTEAVVLLQRTLSTHYRPLAFTLQPFKAEW